MVERLGENILKPTVVSYYERESAHSPSSPVRQSAFTVTHSNHEVNAITSLQLIVIQARVGASGT